MLYQVFYTFVIAQIFGMYLVIMSILMLSRKDYFRNVISKIKPEDSSIFVFANFGLILGLYLVGIHNQWSMKPGVFVTIIAWLVLIKSILWLGLPYRMLNFAKYVIGGIGFYFAIIFAAVYGVILMTVGYYLFYFYKAAELGVAL